MFFSEREPIRHLPFDPAGKFARLRGHDRRVDRNTIFHWASCTKTLTGIAIMQLRDRQLLRLQQPIVDFLPELRQVHDPRGELASVSLAHLLSHSGGFRMATWPWGGDQPWHPHEPTQCSQLVAMMPYTEIEFSPGTKFHYSNPGIVFLGRTIELLTGDDYEVYMDKNVLRPLGMGSTYFDITPYHLQRHRSHSYRGQGEKAEDLGPDFDTGITVSNGGLNAPLPDMAKYLASEASCKAADMCMQTHGGFAFAEEYDVERKFRETRLYMTAPINNNLVLAFLGQHVLKMPRSY